MSLAAASGAGKSVLAKSSSPASRGGSLSCVAIKIQLICTKRVVIPCVAGRFFERRAT